MKRMTVLRTLAVLGLALGVLGHQAALAQQRSVLSKTDLTESPGKEAVVLTVVGAPALVGGKHYHPGDEFLYLLEGTLIIDVEGQAPVTLKAGETYHVPPRAVHRASNPNPAAPFKVLTFGVFDKGQPDTTPVK